MPITYQLWRRTALAVIVAMPIACGFTPTSAEADVQAIVDSQPSRASALVKALVAFGPRVTGTPAAQQASFYLIGEYRKAGYTTEIQTFTYSKFADLGSRLKVGDLWIKGRALSGSPAGNKVAPLVAVPNVGRPEDYGTAGVKGAIALVRRGELRFLEKARNAAAAGAVGLVIVNSEPGELSGSLLGGEVSIPVFALSGSSGKPLLERAQQQRLQTRLEVNTRQRTVTGRNVIAHLPGVTQPSLLLGAHYDSVVGSPGANDNASGTAVVLDLARRLAGTPLARQTWFVAFDGEEDGLRGSAALVKAAQPEFLQKLKGMLNFDMVGVNDKLLVDASPSLTALIEKVDSKVSILGARTGGSDHQSFASAGVPTLFFYRGTDPNYHQPTDTSVEPKLLDATAFVALEVVQRLMEP